MYAVNQPGALTDCEQTADGNYVITLTLIQKSTNLQLATFQKIKQTSVYLPTLQTFKLCLDFYT